MEETIVKNKTKINIATPKPTLLINSDSIYSLTIGLNLGTNIIVIIIEKIHFINENKLRENPFM